MAVYRSVQLSFWTDNKVEDEFTPEDKFFYIYLLTNPQTNICGCYEVSYAQMTRQTGYNKDTIIRLLERFDKVHNVIRFDAETKEILILHWYKYNWSKSERVLTGVLNVAKHIKSEVFRKFIYGMVNAIKNDTLCIGHTYPMETSVSVIYNNIINNLDNNNILNTTRDNNINNNNINTDIDINNNINTKRDIDNNIYINIINYLNARCNTRYKHNIDKTRKCIRARLAEGYTEQDFYTVIDKKAKEWLGTDMEKYLRPETLFGTKFESYLNQNIVAGTSKQKPVNRAQSQLNSILDSIREDIENEQGGS